MIHYTTTTKEILKLWTPEQIRAVFEKLRPYRAESLVIFQRADRRIANELKEIAGLPRHNLIAE